VTSVRRTTAAAIVAAAVIAGCGGSSSSSVTPAAYVKSVCGAVGTFKKDIQAKTASLSSTSVTNPAEGKKALQDFLSAAATGAEDTATKLKSAGTPDVSNGSKISSSLVNAFNQLASSFKQAESSANSLPTSSAAAFRTGAVAIQSSIRNSLTGLLSGLSGLQSPDLAKAAKSEPSCTTLAG
jgi:hypothetical protein